MGYKNFREVYHKLSIVLDNGYCYNTLCMPETKKTELPMEVNSALVYGYIDKMCGFSYKVLGFTYYEDGDYTLVWPNDEIGFTVRGECFKAFDFIPIENKAIYKRYEQIIESTNECYSNTNDEKTRSFTFLDPFRHEDYPDDVLVLIINHQYRKKEQIWVRLNKYIGKDDSITAFLGTLLDEPFDDIYGMHSHDEILIGYITPEDGDPFLIGLPKNSNL